MAWTLIPGLFNLLMTLVPTYLEKTPSPGIRILLVVVLIALYIFCTAQSLGQFAGISRLAYQSLGNTSPASIQDFSQALTERIPSQKITEETTEETPERALKFTQSRKFSFLGASIIQGLIFVLTGVALIILLSILAGIILAIVGAIASSTGATGNPIAGIVLALAFLALLLAYFYACFYIFVRFMLVEKPLAIEQDADVFAAVERSWRLTKHRSGRSMLVAAALFLIAIAAYLIPILAISTTAFSDLSQILSTENPDPEQIAQALQPLYIPLFAAGIAIQLLLTPLFKTTFTALYFDLRHRFENLTLQKTTANRPLE